MLLWSCLENLIKTIKRLIISQILNCILEQSSRIFIVIQRYPVYNKAELTISGIQSMITRLKKKKKQRNMTHSEKKNSQLKPNKTET